MTTANPSSTAVPNTTFNMVRVRRVIKNLRHSAQPGKYRGALEDWKAADAEAHAAYLSLFTETEKARVLDAGKELKRKNGRDDDIETFEDAVRLYGISLIELALLGEA